MPCSPIDVFTSLLRRSHGFCVRSSCRFLMMACLLSSVAIPQAAFADAADDAYALARKLYQDDRWELSAQRFRKFLEDYPKHERAALARLYLGLALVNLNDYRTARVELRQFVKDHPESRNAPDAAYRVGECSYLLNDLKAAEQEFNEFLKLAPDHDLTEWALPYLGDTQLRLGKAADAQQTFAQALEKYPQGRMAEDARYGLARTYEKLNETDKALKLYEQMAEAGAGRLQAQAQLRIGLTHFGTRDYAKAAAACDLLVERFPSSTLVPLAQMNAGFAYYQDNQYEQAITRFEQLRGDAQRAATAAYWKARSEVALTRYADAVQTIRATPPEQISPELKEQMEYLEALALLRDGKSKEAAEQFLQVANDWPEGANADDALHFAAESNLLAGQLKEARDLADRFTNQFPDSPLRDRHDVLSARILFTIDAVANRDEATTRLNRVLRESSDEEAQVLARIYLTRVLQAAAEHQQALDTIRPVIATLGERLTSEEATALVLEATSLLELKQYPDSIASLDRLLAKISSGDQVILARSLRAVANARQKDRAAAEADLKALKQLTTAPEVIGQTMLDLAEAAYQQEEWDWARELFTGIQDTQFSADLRSRGVSGAAWCAYQRQDFATAAMEFDRVVELDARHLLAAEASQMKGRALEAAGNTEAAISAYLESLDRFAPATSITDGRPETESQQKAYESGKLALQLLETAGEVERAEQLFRDLTTRFSQARDVDQLLERWAFLLLENEKFDDSDRLFERLIQEHPQSDRVDTARYQLAESQLIVANDLEAARTAFAALADDDQADSEIRQACKTQLIRLDIEAARWADVEQATRKFLADYTTSSFRDEVELHLANALLNRNQLQPAEELLNSLRDRFQADVQETAYLHSRATLLLGEVFLSGREYDQLDQLVKDYAADHADSRELLELKEVQARSWIKRSEFALARDTFQKVIDDKELGKLEIGARSQLMIAESWFFEEKYSEALEAYYLVVLQYEAYPRWTAAARYQIGQCDEAEKRWDKAARSYRELIEKHPESEFAQKAAERLKVIKQPL